MKRVVIYGRVSTSHHDQNPFVQIEELKRYCVDRSWNISHEIVDYASGGTDKREGYQKLLKLVESGEVDCIVVTKLDRLFRSLKHLVTALDHFQSKGIAFVATRDAIDYTSPTGRMFAQILGSLAEFEKSLCRTRTISGLEYARNVKGKILGRPKKHQNLELMQTLYSQGLTLHEIAKLVGCSHMTVHRALKAQLTKVSA